MRKASRVAWAGSIIGMSAAALAFAAASGCSFSSTSAGDKPDANFPGDSSAFDGPNFGDSGSPADGGANGDTGITAQDGGNDGGSPDASEGGVVCTGDGGSGTFTCAGNMTTARVAAGTAPLPGGKALVAGGWNATSQTLTSAEVYDPASNTFTATGPMNSAHLWGAWGLNLPVLPGPKVLAAGGLDNTGALVSEAEVYDPIAGTFTATGSMVTAVISMFPVKLQDQSILFIGGWNSTTGAPPTPGWMYFGDGTSEVQRYTPGTGVFADTGPLGENRLVGCNVVLDSGFALSVGGSTGTSTSESNVEQYDPVKGEWLSLGTLTAVPGCTTAFLLTTGNVLMLGTGSTANADVLTVNGLTTAPTTGFPATWVPSYVQLQTGDVLAYGGTLGGVITAQAMVYSTTSNAWTAVGSMAQVRGGAMSGILLSTGNVLIVGGSDTGTNELATAEIYHP
jgi:hypothetical protein